MNLHQKQDAQKQKGSGTEAAQGLLKQRTTRGVFGRELANPYKHQGEQHRCSVSQNPRSVNGLADLSFARGSAPALLAKHSLLPVFLLPFCASAASEGVAEHAFASLLWLVEGLLSLGVMVCFFGCLYGACRLLWWGALLLEVKGKGVVGGLGAAGSCPNCGHPISPGVIKVTPGGESEELEEASECEVRFNVKVGNPKGKVEGRL